MRQWIFLGAQLSLLKLKMLLTVRLPRGKTLLHSLVDRISARWWFELCWTHCYGFNLRDMSFASQAQKRRWDDRWTKFFLFPASTKHSVRSLAAHMQCFLQTAASTYYTPALGSHACEIAASEQLDLAFTLSTLESLFPRYIPNWAACIFFPSLDTFSNLKKK